MERQEGAPQSERETAGEVKFHPDHSYHVRRTEAGYIVEAPHGPQCTCEACWPLNKLNPDHPAHHPKF